MARARTLYEVLRHEIEHGTQRSVAVLYALCFLAIGTESIPVADYNRAIIERWSAAGLERVKTMAWKIHDALANAKDKHS